MAEIGCLGDVVFQVSSERVLTPGNGASWTSGAGWTEHQRHLRAPALEFTGLQADGFRLPIRLSRAMGVEPMEMIWTLFDYERAGLAMPLIIGTHAYGMYRWVITNVQRTLSHYDGHGDLLTAELVLTLKGYVK